MAIKKPNWTTKSVGSKQSADEMNGVAEAVIANADELQTIKTNTYTKEEVNNISAKITGDNSMNISQLESELVIAKENISTNTYDIKSVGRIILDTTSTSSNVRLNVPMDRRCRLFQLDRIGRHGSTITEKYIGESITDSEWLNDSNWIEVAYLNPVRSFVDNNEIFKLSKYPRLTTETNKFIRSDGELSEIVHGSSGYASNLYLGNAASTVVPQYKTISYINEPQATVESSTIQNTTKLIKSYIYNSQLSTTTIDAGVWKFAINMKVNNSESTNKLVVEIFKRSSNGVETNLFNAESHQLINNVFNLVQFESIQEQYTVAETDRLGVRIYGKTDSIQIVEFSYYVGGSSSSYINTPIAIRHNQLRSPNEDAGVQHMTSLEKNILNSTKSKTVAFITDVPTTRRLVTISERANGYKLTYNNKTEQYIGTSSSDSEWVKDSNWKTFKYAEDAKSLLEDEEIIKLSSYPFFPARKDSKFVLCGDRSFRSVPYGSGGYGNNYYFTNEAGIATSDVPVARSKAMSKVNDVSVGVYVASARRGSTELVAAFTASEVLGVNVIDAGSWKGYISYNLSGEDGNSHINIQMGTVSPEGNWLMLGSIAYDVAYYNHGYPNSMYIADDLQSYAVDPTHRLQFRVYFTSSAAEYVNCEILVGGTKPSWISTPERVKHSQLLGINEDSEEQHVSAAEKLMARNVKSKTVAFITDTETTRKLVPSEERVNGYKLTYSNKTEQYIGTLFTDVEWVKNSNWITLETKNNKNAANGYAGLDANKRLANEFINTNFRKGFGYLFDGVDDYLSVAHNDKLNFGTDDFTLQVLAEITPSTKEETIISKRTIEYPLVGFYLRKTSSNAIRFILSNNAEYYTDFIITQKRLYSFIFIKSGDKILIYESGVLGSVGTVQPINISGSFPLIIGNNNVLAQPFNGKISLIRLFNRALSQADITYYENNGRPDLQRLKYEDVITNYGELVTNGTFDSVTSWRQAPNDTPTLSNGRIVSTSTGTSYNGGVYSQLARSVELGKRYRLKFDVESNAVYPLISGFSFGYGSLYNQLDYITQIGITKIIKEKIITDKSCDTIILYPAYNTASSVSYDNISVKQVGCVLELLPENALPDRWLESQNGLDATTSGNPAINTETPVTDYSIVDNITNNIAIGTANRDYILPAGYIVDSVCVNSTVALTALQLVNITTSETLLTGKTASASANKHLPITADQSSSRVDTTIRLNCVGNTGLGFNIVINIKKCL